ncbi:MAG: quinolinate synthase NadA [Candidatus Caldatribacteriota bacterium]|nr:quinolinate synthase NadA [Candidatus Caldatribacteriota bacterium]
MNKKIKKLSNKKLIKNILIWKKKRDAVILAHVYQPGEIQDIADFTGDSLFLSKQAAKTKAKVILFCGVQFMAETASILSPEKIVLLPDIHAGCLMANMAPVKEVEAKIKEIQPITILSYVNSFAAVKALSDYCCTSANAVKVAQSISKEKDILFLPDKNLARFTASKIKQNIIPWKGYCPAHNLLTKEDVLHIKNLHPQALLLVHPECRPEVCDLADYVGSTKGIIEFVKDNQAKEYIIGTEIGILHPLKKNNPSKQFYPASNKMVCQDMKLISLQKILSSLKKLEPRIKVPEEIRNKALIALNRMMEISK